MNTTGAIRVEGPPRADSEGTLSPAALAFVAELQQRFGPAIELALTRREERKARFAAGEQLDFLESTRTVRESDWKVPVAPPGLVQRTIEITGPVDRKMIINALNSGADVFMADFEDATSPTWDNLIQGQANLRAAVRRTLVHDDAASGKHYALNEKVATLVVRPRGLHLTERHLTVGSARVRGALMDFGLYVFHNAAELLARGSGPYFYIPKLESHLEARIWHEIFTHAEDALGIPRGSIRATVLIETLPAAFEMDEILYELKEHATGLNCGRWDYIFSAIKTRQSDPSAIYPDRGAVTMTQPSMRAYTQLAVKTCHRRGAHAMGGMSAFIPAKDPEVTARAFEQVTADKTREAGDGHDGTWVAHPALVPVARAAFEAKMHGPNQLGVMRDDVMPDAAALLAIPAGPRTDAGLRLNIRVGIRYLESWLMGLGAVPLYNLMEDAATAEISRAQIWQWLRHRAVLDDGREVTAALVSAAIGEEMEVIAHETGDARFSSGRFSEARTLFTDLVLSPALADFLTLAAYERLEVPAAGT